MLSHITVALSVVLSVSPKMMCIYRLEIELIYLLDTFELIYIYTLLNSQLNC